MGVKKQVELFIKSLLGCKRCKNPHEKKIFFLAWVVIFWKSRFACKYSMRKTQNAQNTVCAKSQYWNFTKGTIMNRKHVRDLKCGIYLPCVVFHRFDVAIFKILLFGHFMAKKPRKNHYGRHFLTVFRP